MTKNFPNGILKQKKKAFTQTVALTAIVTMLGQNLAWATCSDGSTLPAGGFVIGQPPVVNPVNWSPNVFTAPAQGIFVPDASVNENNDPAQPPTNGGHNWVFDQGSTLCRQVDVGTAAGTTAWSIPPNTSSQCVILPIVKNGAFLNLGDIPFQGQAITPTCDPTLLAQPKFNKNNLPNGQFTKPSTANSYANMLGCALSAFNHPELVSTTFPTTGLPAATNKQNATTYMFVAGIKGGMFVVTLENTTPSTVPGTAAGKLATGNFYYSAIPEGQKLTNGVVSPDGMFAVATSIRRNVQIWGCLNPLGDPGDPTAQALPNAVNPTLTNTVQCIGVGTNGLTTDLTTIFGGDNQPYFGGQRVVTSFDQVPGGKFASAWPHCIYQTQFPFNPTNTFAIR